MAPHNRCPCCRYWLRGLSAAIKARTHNVHVLVIEKMHGYGGNSIISDGGIAAPNTHLQKKFMIKDDAALMYRDMLTGGGGEALSLPIGKLEKGYAFDAQMIDTTIPTARLPIFTQDENLTTFSKRSST